MIGPLRTKIFADSADLDHMVAMAKDPVIEGFTTNPTLMRRAGVADYESFCRKLTEAIPDHPISFEAFADDFWEMEEQAREISTWGPNVYVKIPVTNTRREFAGPLVERLSADGIKVNVTAVMTLRQVRDLVHRLSAGTASIVSVFAGRIADTGCDPVPVMAEAVEILADRPRAELLWASPREVLNIFQADSVGCHIITATLDLIAKLAVVGKDLTAYSLETVEMFHDDARAAGYTIGLPRRMAATA